MGFRPLNVGDGDVCWTGSNNLNVREVPGWRDDVTKHASCTSENRVPFQTIKQVWSYGNGSTVKPLSLSCRYIIRY